MKFAHLRKRAPAIVAVSSRIFLAFTLCVFPSGVLPRTRTAGPRDQMQAAKRPNIVFILADDFSMNLIQFMPNLQAMQTEGTTFSHYFVTDSLCCPSRSSIFTGKFPHNTGVFKNTGPDGGYDAFNSHGNESQTFALALQRAGYRTAMLRKYLNGYFPIRHGVARGWNEWDVAGAGYPEFNYRLNQNGKVVAYGSDEQAYLTDVISRLGKDFIAKSGKHPFFIEIATFAPHAPYIPALRDAEKFPGLKAPHTAAFGARPDETAPAWLKNIPPLEPMNMKAINRAFRMRAQAVLAIDQMIGEIRSSLQALGDDDTYIVFSSDNGLHLGEYPLRPGKMTPFDIDINVPLVIVGPGVRKGEVVDAMAENIDLCPTFDDLGGASSPTSPDGHSLVTLLQGKTDAEWRQMTLIEHHHGLPPPGEDDPDAPEQHSANPPSYEALRTKNGLYVEYETGEISYYDLAADPAELRNIAAQLSEDKRRRMHEVLSANAACHGAAACWDAQHRAL